MNVDNCTIMQVSLCDTVGLSLLIPGISLYYISISIFCMCQLEKLESSLVCDSPLFHQIVVNM